MKKQRPAANTAGKFHRLVTVFDDAMPVMVAKTAPYPPGVGFREFPAGQYP